MDFESTNSGSNPLPGTSSLPTRSSFVPEPAYGFGSLVTGLKPAPRSPPGALGPDPKSFTRELLTMRTLITLLCGALLALAGCFPQPRGYTVTVHADPPPAVTLPPANEHVIALAPVRVSSESSVVFWNETFPIEDAVAQFLARPIDGVTYSVVPPATTRALITRMQMGYFPETEGQCAPLPSAASVMGDHFEHAHIAETHIHCAEHPPQWAQPGEAFTPGCDLTITLTESGDHESQNPTVFEGHFPVGVSLNQIRDAIAAGQLTRKPPANEGGAGGLGLLGALVGESATPNVSFDTLNLVGQWGMVNEAMLQQIFNYNVPALNQCEDGEPRFDFWGNPLLVEVNGMGFVTRCENEMPDHLPLSNATCRCNVISSRMNFGMSQGPRRMRLEYSIRQPQHALRTEAANDFRAMPEFHERTASDPSTLLGTTAFPREQITECLKAVNARVPMTRVLVNFEVNAQGRVVHTDFRMPAASTPLPDSLRACVAQAANTIRFTCPFSGRSTVSADIELSMERNSHRSNTNDEEDAQIAALHIELPHRSDWLTGATVPFESPLFFVTAAGALVDVRGHVVDAAHVEAADIRLAIDRRAPMSKVAAIAMALRANIVFALGGAGHNAVYVSVRRANIPLGGEAQVVRVTHDSTGDEPIARDSAAPVIELFDRNDPALTFEPVAKIAASVQDADRDAFWALTQ